MAHKKTVRLHAEYKPMLSLLNVVLDFSDWLWKEHEAHTDVEPFFVDVEADCITVRSGATSCIFELQDLEMLPTSCRGLRWCSASELHLSLQAKFAQGKGVGSVIHCKDGTIAHFEEEVCLNNQEIMVKKIKQCENRCYCTGCGRPIFTSKGSFKRVLPLPSENWSDFADIWFCHNHQDEASHSEPAAPTAPTATCVDAEAASACDHAKDSTQASNQQQGGVKPRPGDCLVSTLYMLVDSTRVCRTTVGITPQTQRLVCLRCGNFIGFVKTFAGTKNGCKETPKSKPENSEVFKIYLHAVKFLSPETFQSWDPRDADLPFDGFIQNPCDSLTEWLVEDFLCHLLKDQCRLFTSFRFIVQSSHEEHADSGPIVLLLWLLDQNLQIFSSTCSVMEGHRHVDKTEVGVTRVLKLLYKATFLQTGTTIRGLQGSVYKMWERDNTVHSVDLPYPLCKQLLSFLIKSTKQLPISQRSLNSFHVGYLKYRPVVPVTG